ncbi:unnamed protein product, partial [Discosporangium mesarthrocarpum]
GVEFRSPPAFSEYTSSEQGEPVLEEMAGGGGGEWGNAMGEGAMEGFQHRGFNDVFPVVQHLAQMSSSEPIQVLSGHVPPPQTEGNSCLYVLCITRRKATPKNDAHGGGESPSPSALSAKSRGMESAKTEDETSAAPGREGSSHGALGPGPSVSDYQEETDSSARVSRFYVGETDALRQRLEQHRATHGDRSVAAPGPGAPSRRGRGGGGIPDKVGVGCRTG